jgi:hypothetical protein
VGHILEEELQNRHQKTGAVKQRCIDTWKNHGPQPYDPEMDTLSDKKVKKRLQRAQEYHEKSIRDAAVKQDASTQPKFPIGWGEQVKILGHRSIRYVVINWQESNHH